MKKPLFALFSALCLSASSFAAEFKPFEQAQFNALMQQGKPVLVHVHAEWCPTCKRQEKVLVPALTESQFADLNALKVDYDTQDDALKAFKVNRQSTLILFNQGNEVRRSIAETSAEKLRQFITLP